MLASAAVAAQPAPPDPPLAVEPVLAPPGLTPTLDDCAQTPDDPRCVTELAIAQPVAPDSITCWHGGRLWIFRGGFGNYFWPAGG